MVTYITKEGDVLDWIVWKHYGTMSALKQVMKANPNITNELLPAGIEIKLPYIESVQKADNEVKLWS
jgi:phage tail protein X